LGLSFSAGFCGVSGLSFGESGSKALAARFMLRLRTRRIVAALEPLQTSLSQESLSQAAKCILSDCLRHEICSEDPLDRANDCFVLAHDLVGKRNYLFAALALNRANSAVDAYSNFSGYSASVGQCKIK
jgi:hypothetical protein